jgi:GNAT superfamily N-acetyltransferase
MMRKATPGDIPDMVALQRAVEAEDALWGYRADSPDEWAERDLAWTWVATDDDQLAGFIHCMPRPYAGESVFPEDSRILEIVELAVAESQRERGLGHKLIAAVRRQAQEEGFSHLRVYSAAKRFDDIVRFYRSCGFEPWYLELTQAIGFEPSGDNDAGG